MKKENQHVIKFEDFIKENVMINEKSSTVETVHKIPKEAVLYIFRPETKYTCDKCVFSKNKDFPNSTKCKVLGPNENIKPYGSCGFWIHMDPVGENTPEIPYIGVITKEQAGYFENEEGFSCKRCEYFDIKNLDCERVNKDSEGDTPGLIHPNACCNRWEPDDVRAKLSSDKLTELLSKKS
jgi:hypothetical protein